MPPEPSPDPTVLDLTDGTGVRAGAHTRSALELLAASRTTDEHGYVQLQTIPYRATTCWPRPCST